MFDRNYDVTSINNVIGFINKSGVTEAFYTEAASKINSKNAERLFLIMGNFKAKIQAIDIEKFFIQYISYCGRLGSDDTWADYFQLNISSERMLDIMTSLSKTLPVKTFHEVCVFNINKFKLVFNAEVVEAIFLANKNVNIHHLIRILNADQINKFENPALLEFSFSAFLDGNTSVSDVLITRLFADYKFINSFLEKYPNQVRRVLKACINRCNNRDEINLVLSKIDNRYLLSALVSSATLQQFPLETLQNNCWWGYGGSAGGARVQEKKQSVLQDPKLAEHLIEFFASSDDRKKLIPNNTVLQIYGLGHKSVQKAKTA